MKTPVLAALALALAGTAALAQPAPPPGGSAPRPAPEAAAPPPPPTGAPGEMRPDRGPPPGRDMRADRGPGGPGRDGPGREGPGRDGPPPPPPKAGHIKLETGDLKVDIRCQPDEPLRTCADVANQLLDKLAGTAKR